MIKDLKQRLSLGSILVAAIIGLLIVDRDYFSAAAAIIFAVFALAAQQELYAMMSSSSDPVRKWWGAFMGAVTLGAAWLAPDCRFELLCGSIVLYLIYEVLSCDVEGATNRISATLLPVLVGPVLLRYAM